MMTSNKVCNSCDRTECLIQQYCSEKWFDRVEKNKTVITYKKGQIILHEGMPVDSITFIRKGKVKVCKSGVSGKNQVIRLSNKGEMLGHRGFNRETMPISAIALEDCEICFIDQTVFREAIKHNPELAYTLMQFYADELYDSEIMARNHAQMSVRELVADALVRIYNAYGCSENKSLNIQLSRQDIADIAGTTKEQISKFLYEFKEDGIIDLKGKSILVYDIDRLKKVIIHFTDNH